MSSNDLEQLFQEGVAAIKAGDKATGRDRLMKVVEANQLHEQAWLWLSAAVESKDERILCLQNVLTVNPDNEIAKKGLVKLGGEIPDNAPPIPAAPVPAGLSTQPSVDRPYWADPGDPAFKAQAVVSSNHPLAPAGGVTSGEFKSSSSSGSEAAADLKPGEEWRKKAYSDDYVSDATIVKEMHEAPVLGFNDLASAWVNALIFRVQGPYEAEVRWGSVTHILLNITVGVIFQIISTVMPFAILFLTGQTANAMVKPTIDGLNEILATVGRANAMQIIPRPLQPALAFLTGSQTGVPVSQIPPEVVASFGTVLVIFATVTILFSFVGILFRGWATNLVGEWMGGKGDVIMTTQALSIAYAVTGLVRIPIGFLLPLVPAALPVANGLLTIYEFIQAGVAVQAAHRMNILASLGAVVIASVLSAIIAVILFCCLTWALSIGAR